VPEVAAPLDPGAFPYGAERPAGWNGGQPYADDPHAQPPLDEGLDDAPGDDDVTRQIYVGETFAGANLGVGELLARPSAAGVPSPFEALPKSVPPPALPSLSESASPSRRPPTAQMSYGIVVGIVVGIIALISGALYLTRGSQPASVHFTTAPRDARVRINGKLLSASESPFVIHDLEADRSHELEIEKEGYRSWSTTLALSSGQVLSLPQVTLVPLPAAQTPEPPRQVEPAVEPVAPSAASAARGVVKDRRASVRVTSSKTPAKSAGTKPAASRTKAAAPKAAAPKPAAPAGAAGTGVLRLNSRPWSQVTIDGRLIGNTPQMNLALPAGNHSVVLVNPQFKLRKTIKVRIAAGKTITRVVDLQ
jgi:hypothetical protein